MSAGVRSRAKHKAAAVAVAAPVSAPVTTDTSYARPSFYTLTLAGTEVIFALMEFIFGLLITKDVLNRLYTTIHGVGSDSIPAYNVLLIHFVTNGVVLFIVTYRFSQRLSLSRSLADIVQDQYGVNVSKLATDTFTRVTVSVITLHTVGFAVLIALQHYYDKSIFSLANYYHSETGDYDWIMITDMLVLAPLREEVIFRAVVFCLFYIRIGDDSPTSKLVCSVLAATMFGLVHCLNLLGGRYQSLYIMLQVVLGIELGLFYSLTYALTESLLPTILMHCVNNLYSSFVPLNQALDLSEWLVSVPLMETCVVYGVLITISVRRLYAQGHKPFAPIDGPAVTHDTDVDGQ